MTRITESLIPAGIDSCCYKFFTVTNDGYYFISAAAVEVSATFGAGAVEVQQL
jgi:hypothetical protein